MHQKQPQQFNPELLFHSAQGFFDIGYHLARELKSDKSIKGFQRLAAAVVNFSFATELLLKGVHLLTTKLYLKGHRFWDIYKQLPVDIKSKIESKFDVYRLDKNEEVTSYKLSVKKVDEKEEQNDEPTEIDTVKKLLQLHNNSFDNWRYIYEIKTVGYEYEYNFQLMTAFLKSVIDVLNELLNGRPPKMILQRAN